MVRMPVGGGRTRAQVTLRDGVWEAVDVLARASGVTRSDVIALAVARLVTDAPASVVEGLADALPDCAGGDGAPRADVGADAARDLPGGGPAATPSAIVGAADSGRE